MAKKNRKNSEVGHRWMVLGVAGIAVLAIVATIYLTLSSSCESLGREIKTLESKRADLQKQIVNEERNWSAERSIKNMEQLLKKHGMAMTFPQERNIIRLQAAEPDEPALYAQRSARSSND